ncbi:MAG: OmpA family protein [Bacteriovoracia bacterium]
MAGEEPIIIRRKKVGGGGHGHHGGAWKVAYADFVTAMMAFFLVMWLMGSDEEIKAAVAHYFNHPNTPYKAGRDPKSDSAQPLGEDSGLGQSVLSGVENNFPAEIVSTPTLPNRDMMKFNRRLKAVLEEILEGEIYGLDVNQNEITFSLPEAIIFEPGSADLTAKAMRSLDLLGKALEGFNGFITIAGHTDEVPLQKGRFANNWELSFGRALSVMEYLETQFGLPEEHITPVGYGSRKPITLGKSPEDRKKNRRVEFTLSYAERY